MDIDRNYNIWGEASEPQKRDIFHGIRLFVFEHGESLGRAGEITQTYAIPIEALKQSGFDEARKAVFTHQYDSSSSLGHLYELAVLSVEEEIQGANGEKLTYATYYSFELVSINEISAEIVREVYDKQTGRRLEGTVQENIMDDIDSLTFSTPSATTGTDKLTISDANKITNLLVFLESYAKRKHENQ